MLYLIRHAQASYLSKNYDQLSTLGIEQSIALGNLLSEKLSISQQYIGPHKRQHQTFAEIEKAFLRKGHTIPTPILLNQFKEHSGPATLHHYKNQLITEDPQCKIWHEETLQYPNKLRENSIKRFEYFIPQWMNGKYLAQDFEDFKTFRKEVVNGLEIIFQNHKPNENIFVISSAGTISTIIAELTKIQSTKEIAQLSFEIFNASITSLKLNNDTWSINKFNQVDHLTNNMKTIV